MFEQKDPSNRFNAADIVEIDIGERTVAPRSVLASNGARGRISAVEVGYDLYANADCIGKKNDALHMYKEIPNTEKGKSVILDVIGTIVLTCVETVIPDALYKIHHHDIMTQNEWVLYYRKRKYVYEVEFPLVHYPLFGEPSYSFFKKMPVEEEYLVKVGNIFEKTPIVKPMGFKERLKLNIRHGFRKESMFH